MTPLGVSIVAAALAATLAAAIAYRAGYTAGTRDVLADVEASPPDEGGDGEENRPDPPEPNSLYVRQADGSWEPAKMFELRKGDVYCQKGQPGPWIATGGPELTEYGFWVIPSEPFRVTKSGRFGLVDVEAEEGGEADDE